MRAFRRGWRVLGGVLARLGWLGVFALVLGGLWAAFGRFERG